MTNHTHTPATPTRRTVLRTAAIGAAWTTPAILGVAAAPAIAASNGDDAPLKAPARPTPPSAEAAPAPAPEAAPAPAPESAPAHIQIGQMQFDTWQHNGRKAGGNFGVQIDGPGMTALVNVAVTLSHPTWQQSKSLSFASVIGQSLRFNQAFQFDEALVAGQTYTMSIHFSGTLQRWIDYSTNTRYDGSWVLDHKTMPPKQVQINNW